MELVLPDSYMYRHYTASQIFPVNFLETSLQQAFTQFLRFRKIQEEHAGAIHNIPVVAILKVNSSALRKPCLGQDVLGNTVLQIEAL